MIDPAAHGLIPPTRRPAIPGDGPQSVAAILDGPLATTPDAEALVGSDARYSFRELDAAVDRAAQALARHGAGPGTRIAASLPNSAALVVAFVATQRLGAVWVGIHRSLAPPEMRHQLADSGVRILLAPRATLDALADELAGPEAPHDLERTLSAAPGDPTSDWARALADAHDPPTRRAVDPFGPAAIAYTSGTTGFPKGAVHSQHNLVLPGAVARWKGTHPSEVRHGVVLPLTILNLMVLGPLVAWQHGSACVAIDRIDPVGLAGWIRDERVGHFAGVPTIFHDLLTHPEVKREDLASLRAPEVGGADCPEDVRRLYRERFGCGVGIGYGMTEAPTAVTRSHPDAPPRPGLCGRAEPQIRIEIRDASNRPPPAGEVGEICVGAAREGPFAEVYTPMLGYWNRSDATREALAGDVLHTGDLGLLEPDGTLLIRGRAKELILRGGANVYPAEVERVIAAEPGVEACAVLGLPDERLGERVVAVVQPGAGRRPSVEALRERCRTELARYKVPAEFHFVESFPRNAMGKIVKPELAEQLGRTG